MSQDNKRRLFSLLACIVMLLAIMFVTVSATKHTGKEEDSHQLFVATQVNPSQVVVETSIKQEMQNVTNEAIEESMAEVEESVAGTEEVVCEEEIVEDVVIEEEVSVEDEVIIEEETPVIEEVPDSSYESEDYFMTICSVVEAETKGQDMDAKIHIVHVIRNRVNSSQFPNDYYSVCTAPNQFASRWDIEQSTIDAVNTALSMEDTTGGALFFCTCEGCWAVSVKEYIFTDSAGHQFWR